jgi:hypothetical protein
VPGSGNESQSQDRLFAHNEAGTTPTNDGVLTPTNLSGLGMGTDLTVNEGTPQAPVMKTYAGGITYANFEHVDVLLGSATDDFLIAGTATGAHTTLHAADGNDRFRVKTIGGETTILGQAGDDLVTVADDLATVDQVAGTLNVDGGDTGNDVLTVNDAGDANANTGQMTASKIDGLDMAGLINYADLEELHILLGSGSDTFRVRGTHGTTPTTLTGAMGDDLVEVGNTSKSLADVQGTLTLDAGVGTNILRVTDTGGTTPKHVALTDHSIKGFAPADILYSATGGNFNSNAPLIGSGVLLQGSTSARDAFLVRSTLGGSTTAIQGGSADVYYVGSLAPIATGDVEADFPVTGPVTDNGDLDTIRGRLRLTAPATGLPSQIYVNDHANVGRANYTVTKAEVVNFTDPTNPVPARPDFAGIDYTGQVNELRVDATDDVNVFDAKPSTITHYTLDANLPVGGVPIVGGGDYMRLDTNTTSGRKLHITSLGTGFWRFTSKHKEVAFESMERFNHVDLIAYQGDKGKPTQAPRITVRDAENGVLKFANMAYEATYRGPVRWATADMNWDGLPDLITVSGKGRATEVHVYNGTPNAAGAYSGQLLTSFRVLPTGVTVGAHIAVGDVNHDGAADIVTGADAGWSPEVRVWDGLTALTTHSQLVSPFMPYPATFRGGVRVAVGDLDETTGASTDYTGAEIVTSPGKGMAPTIGIYRLNGGLIEELRRFNAYPPTMTSAGLFVAIGDYNGDKVRDLIVSPGSGVAPKVNIFSGVGLLTHTGPTEKAKWSLLVSPTTNRAGVGVVPVPKTGGNPFAVEWVTLRYTIGPK